MNWSVVDLEAALADLSRSVEWPPVPDVSESVRARTASSPVVPSPLTRPRWIDRAALVAAALVLGVFGTLLARPGFREATADFLGAGRVKIEVDENVPTPTTTAPDLGIGRESSLDEVEGLFGHVEVPTVLGLPDTVYLSDFHEFAALVYDATAELPEIGETGAGVIIFRLPDFPEWAYLDKTLGPAARIRPVKVNGVEGIWARGVEHALSFEGSTRVAGNALIWQKDKVTFRIESMLSLEEVRAIARSLE